MREGGFLRKLAVLLDVSGSAAPQHVLAQSAQDGCTRAVNCGVMFAHAESDTDREI
ncbi:hypothetical protein J6590_036449 [Homalodisca vitripennis]|nr:hypothetical protein J6590_036449 [Homalodisca vitripennis]